ncbi:MAG: hypothetical protein ABR567_11155 [Myxococcales bacterium]
MPTALQRTGTSSLQAFSHASYTLVRPLFSWSRVYRVFAPDGSLAAFVSQPWFRLRTELIIYGDEEETQPILVIKNRRFAAVNMEHDLFDAMTGARLGVVRTRGLSSLFRDTWDILDADERPAGLMIEDGPYFWRRFLKFIPGRHHIELGGRVVATIAQVFHFFRREFELDIIQQDDPIEPRFAIVCALIAMMADLRSENRE